jgi:SOS-response transcriptional repressor LexA
VNSPNAFEQVGCIHTVQGYDLNYAGVIFGREINYNPKTEEIEIDSSKYYDTYGRIGVDAAALKNYIVNIYKTLMYRGIKGTYVYACNKELNEYLKLHIESFKNEMPFRILKFEDVKPYVNSIPLLDIYAAAGAFSELQHHQELTWVEPPFEISANKKYFICKVLGESMNLKIPSGSYCLFRTDEGGSRNGKIVLVQSSHVHDSEFGAGYTVKEYHSKKDLNEFGWKHEEIVLKPRSQSADYKEIKLKMDELTDFKVLGVLERVITAESNRHK